MNLIGTHRSGLVSYVNTQLANFFPDGADHRATIDRYVDDALARTARCVDAVRMWRPGEFNYLHSSQYCTFLYYLSNCIWRDKGDLTVATKLFGLNKALNAIDLFYEIEMPEVFLIGHSVGIVLAKATYGNYLVLYQNSTVGKNHGVAPVIGEGVVMYPNTAIIGRSHVRDNSVVAQGVSVLNRETPGNCLVYGGQAGELVYKPARERAAEEYFRL